MAAPPSPVDPIAAALLDQQLLSGVGNVYRLDALFVNGIQPDRVAASLSRAELDALWDTLRTMLQQVVEERRIVTVHPPERAAAGANGVECVLPEDDFYGYRQHRVPSTDGRWQRDPSRARRAGRGRESNTNM